MYLPIQVLYPFYGTLANSAEPDQMPHNAAPDQVLHCLHTRFSFKIWMKLLIITQQQLNSKCIRPIDKGGKFY